MIVRHGHFLFVAWNVTSDSQPTLVGFDQSAQETPARQAPPQKLRIFISRGGDMEMVGQVETMLGLADMEGEVAEKEETTAIPVPEKVFAAMRRCNAGIIVVSVDEEHKDGSREIRPQQRPD